MPSATADRLTTSPGLFRFGLLIVAIPQLFVSGWALLAPRSFSNDFPGFGREWVTPLGPYNEHFVIDYGSFTLALALLLAIAAWLLERRVVQVALVVWIVGAVPHFIYHSTVTERFDTTDNVGNLGALGLDIVVPAILLVLSTRGGPDHGQDRSGTA